MKTSIFWKKISQSTYLYGSDITLDSGKVVFSNPLLPVGAIIQKWQSQTNYQADRQVPELPLLERGRTYSVTFNGETKPKNTIYIQLEFFDRYHNRLKKEVLKDAHSQFTYPKEAYFYHLALLNAGCQWLTLDSIEIEEVVDEAVASKKSIEYDCVLFEKDKPEVLVIFLEKGHQLSNDLIEKFAHRGNIIVIEDTDQLMTVAFQEKLADIMTWSLDEKLAPTVAFAGYGAYGNLAALKAVKDFSTARAFVTGYWHKPKAYAEVFFGSNITAYQEIVSEILAQKQLPTVQWYSPLSEDDNLQCVIGVLSQPEQLVYLPQFQ